MTPTFEAAPSVPLLLQRVGFTRTRIDTLERHAPGQDFGDPPPLINNVNIEANADDPSQFAVKMSCVFNPELDPRWPYSFDVVCFAVFRRVIDLSQEDLSKALIAIGHNVCYGAVREHILSVTSRHAFGPMLLGLSAIRLDQTAAPDVAESIPPTGEQSNL